MKALKILTFSLFNTEKSPAKSRGLCLQSEVGRFSPLFLIMDGSEFLFLHFLHLCRQIVTIQ